MVCLDSSEKHHSLPLHFKGCTFYTFDGEKKLGVSLNTDYILLPSPVAMTHHVNLLEFHKTGGLIQKNLSSNLILIVGSSLIKTMETGQAKN